MSVGVLLVSSEGMGSVTVGSMGSVTMGSMGMGTVRSVRSVRSVRNVVSVMLMRLSLLLMHCLVGVLVGTVRAVLGLIHGHRGGLERLVVVG